MKFEKNLYDYAFWMNKQLLLILLVGTFILFLAKFFLDRYRFCKKRNKYIKSNINQIDKMEGEEFEEYLQVHFQKRGYKASLTPKSRDYGADLIFEKGSEKMVIQVKRYREKVGIKAVQEIVGAIGHYGAHRGMVITNSFYTKSAWELAKSNNIELWDRNTLIRTFKIK